MRLSGCGAASDSRFSGCWSHSVLPPPCSRTAMIYAQLRTVPQWKTWLTPLVYLGFALASAGCSPRVSARTGRRKSGASACRARLGGQMGLVGPRHPHPAVRCLGSTPETATGLGFIRQGAAARAAAFRRELPDPRDGSPDRPQARPQTAPSGDGAGCSRSGGDPHYHRAHRRAGRASILRLRCRCWSDFWLNAGCSSPKPSTPCRCITATADGFSRCGTSARRFHLPQQHR